MSDDPTRRPFRLALGAKHLKRDVDQEIEFHIAMRTQALVAQGLDAETARARAVAQFGDSAAVREECVTIDTQRSRAMTLAERLGNFRQDVAYAVRTLRQHPAFAGIVILILALGIGANTATFSVIDALMLRPLPVSHPEALVTIGDPRATGRLSEGTPESDIASYPLYTDLRDGNHVLTGLYGSGRAGRLNVVIDQAPASAKPGPTEGSIPTAVSSPEISFPSSASAPPRAARSRRPRTASRAPTPSSSSARRTGGNDSPAIPPRSAGPSRSMERVS